jgi:serine/threonine-protein kinase
VWREGLVDSLARSLDGAGPLRTVAPSTSIAKSSGRGDVTTAVSLGTSVGAGLVVFGELNPMGQDSVRARVAIADVANNKLQHNIDVMGDVTRIDALADSVSLQLLRALGSDGLAGGARLSSLGTSSVAALKAYLVGQQYYRRGLVDSSRRSFEEAVAADSLFSLSWRGVASVYIRTGRENMPEAKAALDRAIRLRRAGSPRDSLLLHGDSLRLAIGRRTPAANDAVSDVAEISALLATLEEATRRYPIDAELWMELADAGYHFGYLTNRPDRIVLREFEQAIALDSMMMLPYVHAQTLAVRTTKFRAAATYARRMATLGAPQVQPYYALLATVLDSAPVLSAIARAQLDTSQIPFTATVARELSAAPEATALSVTIAKLQLARLAKTPTIADAAAWARALTLIEAGAGGALTSPQTLTITDRAQLAAAGVLPVDTVLSEAAPYLERQPLMIGSMLSLFAGARNDGAVRTVARMFDSVDVAMRGQGNVSAAHRGELARAFDILARGDSVAALRAFLAVPMSTYGDVPCAPGTFARLLAYARRDAETARVLDRSWSSTRNLPSLAPLMLLRGELAERLNDKAAARDGLARAR